MAHRDHGANCSQLSMNPRLLKLTLLVAITLLVIGGVYYLTRSAQFQSKATPKPAEQSSVPSPAPTNAKLSDDALATAKKYWGINPPQMFWKIPKAEIDRALTSSDYSVCAQALGRLLNTHFPREDAIAALKTYLSHPSAEVRFLVANQLFMLGSDAGRDVMVSMLMAGANGENIPMQLVVGAAQILYQYRQPFDSQLLVDAYSKTEFSLLKSIMVLEQLPEAKNLVADALGTNTYLESNAIYAGILRMDDAATLAKLRLMLELTRPNNRLAAHWALSQITGSETDLGYVIELAKPRAGLLPKPSSYDQSLALDAIRLLTTTVSPQARNALKEISEHAAQSGDHMVFDMAFASLYYVQKDYAYVDQKVAELMNGPKGKPSFSTVWKIAAERRTPQLELLAVERNSEAYKQHFILEQGRPVEYWIYQYLSNIPANVLPPVRQ